MIEKPIGAITLADLQDLIGVAREDKTLEFKVEIPGKLASDSVPVLAGVSSLANSAGGDFVLGVAAKDGLAASVPGVTIPNIDAETLCLEQMPANGLEPRLLRLDIRAVPCADNSRVEQPRHALCLARTGFVKGYRTAGRLPSEPLARFVSAGVQPFDNP